MRAVLMERIWAMASFTFTIEHQATVFDQALAFERLLVDDSCVAMLASDLATVLVFDHDGAEVDNDAPCYLDSFLG